MKSTFANISFLGCALLLIIVTLVKPRYLEQHTNATLAWDVSGYYLYLPAQFIYNDLYELKFLPDIIEKYTPSPSMDQAYPIENGHLVMKYSAGMAVQYAPSFFISHAIAALSNTYPADGFSFPYQAGIHWGSVFYAIIGLFFLKKILSRYFSQRSTGWTLIAIVAGSNYLNYATFDAANTHAYLFTLVAILVWSTIRFYESFAWKHAILIGLSLGLAALTRPTEIIYAAIPLLWGVGSLTMLKDRWTTIVTHLPKIATAIFITGAIGFLQLLYWKSVSGHWLQYSYQDQGFSFLRPHFTDVFFSYRKGWLVYSPLMSLAIIGLVPLFFRSSNEGTTQTGKSLFPLIFFFLLINTWIICAWDIWWYGGAFGQRAFIQSYVLWAFPMAAFFEWLQGANRKGLQLLAATFTLACLALNLFQTYQAHWGPFETEAMTKAYYWKIFGKTQNDPYDRLLLDAKEGFDGERNKVKLLINEDFETGSDSTFLNKDYASSGKWSTQVHINQAFSPAVNIPWTKESNSQEWLSVYANFYSDRMTWGYWQMPQLVVRFEQDDVPVKERIIRPFRVMKPNEWARAGMDVRLPNKPFNNIEIFLWNAGGLEVALFMDDLSVELFEE